MPKKYLIITTLLIFLIIGLIFILKDYSDDELNEKKITSEKKIIKIVDYNLITDKYNEKNKKNNQIIVQKKESKYNSEKINKSIEDYIDMMYDSSQNGDLRSPPIDDKPSQRTWKPDPEILDNPDLYAKKQKEANQKAIPKIYEAFGSRIEDISKAVQKAEVEGTRTKEEIDEAKGALLFMKQFQNELAQQINKNEYEEQK